jgi:hypothetical protein
MVARHPPTRRSSSCARCTRAAAAPAARPPQCRKCRSPRARPKQCFSSSQASGVLPRTALAGVPACSTRCEDNARKAASSPSSSRSPAWCRASRAPTCRPFSVPSCPVETFSPSIRSTRRGKSRRAKMASLPRCAPSTRAATFLSGPSSWRCAHHPHAPRPYHSSLYSLAKRGPEAFCHSLRALREKGFAILKLDFRNGFNAISRQAVLDAVQRRCPQLTALMNLFNTVDGACFFIVDNVVETILSAEGVRMGCPPRLPLDSPSPSRTCWNDVFKARAPLAWY